MTFVERYDESGEPIYAADSGPLNNLWKYLAIINDQSAIKLNPQSSKIFDYNEFFKRLCLSRAELDMTNSVLQLLLQEANNEATGTNISIDAVHHEEDHKTNTEGLSKTIYGHKTALLKEIGDELTASSRTLQKNRTEEHEIVSGVLLELREKFRWNLVRISAAEQIQVSVDYQETTPIIGIDYSPYALFKDSKSNREQYNYKSYNQIGSESLAMIMREKTGKLGLLLQSKSRLFMGNVRVSLKDLTTGDIHSGVLYESFSAGNIFDYSNAEGLNGWDTILKEARNRLLFNHVMISLASEASKYPQDLVEFNELCCKIQIQDKWVFAMEIASAENNTEISNSELPLNIYKTLLMNYLTSLGREINWTDSRNEIIK